ncbi:MAG TPA: glycosyltransferase family 2 protein [Syntrophales bacterium]|nr:glycosyltransferase family 2 protein [Syntrophales bacterium]HOL59350.1 glycosyltransferase family 2 protein [Syntrophales bacterium]HPO35458.1 glycosyltransferase family 2 protein [Syntrophales bacterium]
MEKLPLSVAIITLNEEGNLSRALKSVAFASQVVVVDSGSRDRTIEIAQEAGCEIYERKWPGGFGAQKQFALDQCRQQWILLLDADECIPPETADRIREICLAPVGEVVGYRFPRKNFFQGRWIRHAGWWPDRVLRLFRKGKGRMTLATVHEAVWVEGKVVDLPTPIEHYTESDLSRIVEKINRYSSLGAEEALREGRTSTEMGAFFRAAAAFFHNYFLRLGFLDGYPGLTLAVTDAVNKFFKYAKLSQMARKKNA